MIIYVWFDLFSLRDLLFFMAVHGLLVIVPYLVWRLYKPVRILYGIAWTRVYLELFYFRRWLFFTLLAIGIFILPLAAAIVLYWGFFSYVHHADYPSIFAVLTVSTGISFIAVAVPSVWILMHPALEDSARVRLMLNLYSVAIFVFVCDLMAGSRGVLRNTEIRLLDAPYHLQLSLSTIVIVVTFLVVLSIPMFRDTAQQAEGVEELVAFEEGTLRVLSRGFRSLSVTDKVSFVDKKLHELRNREESFRDQLPPPGYLFRKLYDLAGDEDVDVEAGEDHAEEDTDPEKLVEADVTRIATHGLLWTTSSAWGDRVTEILNLGNHMEMLWNKTYAERREELNGSGRIVRYPLRIIAYGETIVYKRYRLPWLLLLRLFNTSSRAFGCK
jgi:hypothetical protein